MKVLSTIFVLATISLVILFSESLYVQGKYLLSYSLTAFSIASVIFWINQVSSVPDAKAAKSSNA